MKSGDRRIVEGADLYLAVGEPWQVVTPRKATVVDAGPFRVDVARQGAVNFVSHHRDDNGTAVLVRVDGEPTDRCVYARHLRGLWLETLAKTGRTVAGVKAQQARVAELGATRRPLTGTDLLRLAACDEGVDDDVFTTMTNHIEGD
jgi:hypothetical protein